MTCTTCGHENRATAKFCEECGRRIVLKCPSCSTEVRPGAKFCDECGTPTAAHVQPRDTRDAGDTRTPERAPAPRDHTPGHLADERAPRDYTPKHLAEKILRSKSVLEGERKQVTVLFADVRGSMDLAEQVGAEEWHRILDRFFEILTAEVHRVEGTVNQYTGDGIMALFGAPIAHEDHALRACSAALRVRDELRRFRDELARERGVDFSTRMGLNSGVVVVGKIGDDLRMDYTAIGHTVGLAARLERLAEVDRPFLSAGTAKLVDGFFELDDLGEFYIKGSKEPVRVFALVGEGALRTRFDLARERGLARLVGRESELATLEAALERSRSQQGQVMGIVGEAGVGKSRLCATFVERCRERDIPVYEARGVAHGRHIPLLPMLELFRSYFGIDQEEDDGAARTKVTERLLPFDERLREELPILFQFLGIPDADNPATEMDPDTFKKRLFAITGAIVHADGAQQASVFVFEDLHWLDATSEALLAEIVETQASTPGFIILNFRPEYQPHWKSHSFYHQMALSPLGEQSTAELVRDRVGEDPSVAALPALVFDRCRGNPFFAEEILQELSETGVLAGERGSCRAAAVIERLEVPATVQATLNARIDRLPHREKSVLQSASVIGKTFAATVLGRTVDMEEDQLGAALKSLVETEFLLQEEFYPEFEYAFKHPLTQEVSYETQLRDRREATHAAVARTLESIHSERLDENAALLAHHWGRAGQPLLAARWLARGAAWIETSDYRQAYEHWKAVAELTRPLFSNDAEETPESREATELLARSAHRRTSTGFRVGADHDELEAVFEEGRALLERLEDWSTLAALAASYAQSTQNTGDVNRYYARTHEARQLAAQSDDPSVNAVAHIECGWSEILKGELRKALASAESALERIGAHVDEGTDLAGYGLYPTCQMVWTNSASALGRLRECPERIDDYLRAARAHGPTETLVWGQVFRAMYLELEGDAAGVIEATSEACRLAEGSGSLQAVACSRAVMGMAYGLAERWSEAEAELRLAQEMFEQHVVAGDFLPYTLAHLAEAELRTKGPQHALATTESTLRQCDEWGAEFFGLHNELAQVRALLAVGGSALELAEETLDRGQAKAERMEARGWIPHFEKERAALARARGDMPLYRAEMSEAIELWREMGATGWVERAKKELDGDSRA